LWPFLPSAGRHSVSIRGKSLNPVERRSVALRTAGCTCASWLTQDARRKLTLEDFQIVFSFHVVVGFSEPV
jgi:hypothetical protein